MDAKFLTTARRDDKTCKPDSYHAAQVALARPIVSAVAPRMRRQTRQRMRYLAHVNGKCIPVLPTTLAISHDPDSCLSPVSAIQLSGMVAPYQLRRLRHRIAEPMSRSVDLTTFCLTWSVFVRLFDCERLRYLFSPVVECSQSVATGSYEIPATNGRRAYLSRPSAVVE